MRYLAFCFLFIAALGMPKLAHAVNYPATTLLAGAVNQSVVSNQCYIARGGSEFQRNGGANRAFVSVSDMVAAGYELNGDMDLSFTTTNSGSVHFSHAAEYPSTIQNATFQGYSQAYNPTTKTLQAHFTINFPSCALLVSAAYYSP